MTEVLSEQIKMMMMIITQVTVTWFVYRLTIYGLRCLLNLFRFTTVFVIFISEWQANLRYDTINFTLCQKLTIS